MQAPEDFDAFLRGLLDDSQQAPRRFSADDRALIERMLRAMEEGAHGVILVKHPDDGSALNALGYLLASRNQKLDEASALISKALVAEADNPAYLDSLGWVYFKQHKYAEATKRLERAAAALPLDSAVLDHLGELYFQQKRYREAADVWLDGDRDGIDAAAITKKRDRARELGK